MTESLAQKILNNIPCAELDYQEWVNVGMALHEEGLPCSLWEEWSQNDSRYHAGECERKWRTFGNGMSKVTLGTMYQMLTERGIRIKGETRTYDFDDMITDDGIDRSGWHKEDTVMQLPERSNSQIKDITDYLSTLFDRDEYVSYVTEAYSDADGKWKPKNGVNSQTCGQILDEISKCKGIDDVFGTTNDDAGAWICFNPMDGTGRGNKNVSSYRYALVESDSQDVETQYALLQDMQLPIKMLVHSGGKSLHAIVQIGAVDYKQYQERVDFLYTMCRKNGLDVDTQDKNPARLSRFPGFKRGDHWQYIVGRDMGKSDFVEWKHYIEDDAIEPLEIENLDDVWNDMPPLKEELISGILRKGHKMILVSSSKAGKTFALIELAIAIAEGRQWFGFQCKQGRVLYMNMELDRASFDDRFKRMYERMNLTVNNRKNIDIVHLRGKIEQIDKLVPQINQAAKKCGYAAIILDPIYKLGIGDENAAAEVSKFCNAIDKIANSGASVIYAHHHSKGQQGAKASMDRASGSGVFARDADALLDMIELAIPDEHLTAALDTYGDYATAWRLESTLREFPQIYPVNLFFSYPLHCIDTNHYLDEAELLETRRSMAYGRKVGEAKRIENKAERINDFRDRVDTLLVFNENAILSQVADDVGITVKTARAYCKILGYDVKNSLIQKREKGKLQL